MTRDTEPHAYSGTQVTPTRKRQTPRLCSCPPFLCCVRFHLWPGYLVSSLFLLCLCLRYCSLFLVSTSAPLTDCAVYSLSLCFNLKESLARKNYIEDTRCECGGEIESLEHVLWQCNKYDEER